MWTALQDKSQQTQHRHDRRIAPWAGIGVERVNDTEGRSESSVGDTSFGGKGRVVEDGGSGRFGSSSSGRGNSDQRSESLADGQSLSDGRVDKVEELSVGVASEQIRNLSSAILLSLANGLTQIDGPWQCR